jgi:hypothetical protein
VISSLLLVVALGLLVSGAGVRIADSVARGSDGYITSSPLRFSSAGYAATSQSVTVGLGSWPDLPNGWLGKIRVTGNAHTNEPLFLGIAPTVAAHRYLAGVAHTTVLGSQNGGQDLVRRFHGGGAPATAPAGAHIWAVSASGPGQRSLTWQPRSGSWTLVVMNASGSTPVASDVTVGAQLPVLGDLSVGLLVAGAVLALIGGAVLAAVLTRRRTPTTPPVS